MGTAKGVDGKLYLCQVFCGWNEWQRKRDLKNKMYKHKQFWSAPFILTFIMLEMRLELFCFFHAKSASSSTCGRIIILLFLESIMVDRVAYVDSKSTNRCPWLLPLP
jgi:hypothetical protein